MAKQKLQTKREQQASQRAELRRRKQRNALLKRGAIVAVALALGGGGYYVFGSRQGTSGVKTGAYPAGRHVSGRITYSETPPLGGPHNPVWQNCSIYDQPIHDEHGVHALEHGAVWITYRPDLPADQVQQLKSLASSDYMLLSPYPNLPAPVVASAWNHQVALESAADPRLRSFISEFKNNPSNTPEFGAACSGGISTDRRAATLNNVAGPMVR